MNARGVTPSHCALQGGAGELQSRGFALIATAVRAASGGEALPGEALLGAWTHTDTQLALLKFAVVAPGELATFARSARRQPVERHAIA